MDDLDVLARDFGLGARGKSNPMRSATSDRRSIDDPLFSDVFGGQLKYTPSSSSNSNIKSSSAGDFDYDSIFKSSSATSETKNSNISTSKPSPAPVYDKPVYDEDIFDGLPGLKSKSAASTVRFEDDVFATISSPPTGKSGNQSNDFDDLLGNLGRNEKEGESNMSSSAKSSSSTKGFDDLLAGFGSASPAASNRPTPESRWGSVPTAGSKNHNTLNDPFAVLESESKPHSSSGQFSDPLDEIGKFSKSRSAKVEVTSRSGGAFDDLDPLGTSGKSANSFSPGRDGRGKKERSPSRPAMPQSATTREPMPNSSFKYSEANTVKKDSTDHFQEPPLFDAPNVSTDFQNSFGQTASPQYYETGPQVDMSPTSEGHAHHQPDDVWLSVSEIPLFTQPTAAPPPSRPPPPIPRPSSRSDTGSSPSYYPQRPKSPKPDWSSDKSPPVSQFDELDDFAMGRSQNNFDESANPHSGVDSNPFSAAAASAAAMKDAMDKAEAKFRHAKEVREREHAKAARNVDSGTLERDEADLQEREIKETQERERKQKEEEEKETRRIERERLRDIERDKGRLAVERATREARERAAAEARERQAADARLKAGRAAVGKANAEARERAERTAVQRAQAEARERAAAEAKERADKAAAEARERASSEAREKEARDRAAVSRAESEARRRSERAAVERAASEARERAAVNARERAAAAAAAASKVNQQTNDDDLESFFSMGRASSAPRDRTNSPNPFSEKQFPNKGSSEAAKRTPSASGATSNMKKPSSTTNLVDDLSSIFGAAPSAGEFQNVEGETEERRRARLDRHQRTQERAAIALSEKYERDLQAQRDQEERHRIAETLDIEIKRWAAGKEGNLRALLSTMQYVLWPECGWQPVSLTDLITAASVKKVYRKATLCIHPDKVQQKGATLQQKYIAEKVFDLLKEAWNKLNSEELF